MGSARVLVLDDEAEVRKMLCRFLRTQGYTVESEGRGTDAIRRLEAEPFDVLVCDLVLSDIRGEDVLLAAVSLPAPPAIIVISGSVDDARERSLLSQGAVAVLRKPFDLARFAELVAEHARPA